MQRENITHTIGKKTKINAKWPGHNIKSGSVHWSIDRDKHLLHEPGNNEVTAFITIDGQCQPRCQYLLRVDCESTDGLPLFDEFWLNIIREPQAPPPERATVSVG